ncbi:MAG TPA: hypothetical protein DCQ04_11300 [Actinobacteria bacterium]|nr:hypothetical protein [Actinomycetota bacterium]
MNSQNVAQDESRQVLVNAVRNVVRYAMRKMKRDIEQNGVTPELFTPKAFGENLASPMNDGIFPEQERQRSLGALLDVVRRGPVTFHFAWTAPGASTPHIAVVELLFAGRATLKIRLLWLALPEKIPVSPRIGVIEGRTPLKEAVFDVVRVYEDGRLEAFPHPAGPDARGHGPGSADPPLT